MKEKREEDAEKRKWGRKIGNESMMKDSWTFGLSWAVLVSRSRAYVNKNCYATIGRSFSTLVASSFCAEKASVPVGSETEIRIYLR